MDNEKFNKEFDKIFEDGLEPYISFLGDDEVIIDGTVTLSELKAIVKAWEDSIDGS